jgi:hypothetical protein
MTCLLCARSVKDTVDAAASAQKSPPRASFVPSDDLSQKGDDGTHTRNAQLLYQHMQTCIELQHLHACNTKTIHIPQTKTQHNSTHTFTNLL